MNSIFFCSLKQKKDFRRLITKGKKISNSLFHLIYFKKFNKEKATETKKQFRYAISVNKKTFRTAVLRNKIKRQIRSLIRNLEEPKNIDCLIVVKKEYLNNDYKNIKKKFFEIYQKI